MNKLPVPINHSLSILFSKGEKVVTEAVINSARLLDIEDPELARIIHVKEGMIPQLRSGDICLSKEDESYDLAVQLITLFCYLDTMVGGSETVRKQWMKLLHKSFNDSPINAIQESPENLRKAVIECNPEPEW